MAVDDGEREERVRSANSAFQSDSSANLAGDGDMGSRKRSHVNFDELLPKVTDGPLSPKKGADVKPVKSD